MGADPGELEFDSASFQSLGRSLSKADYSAPRHAFCARSLLSRSSEAIFFSAPPGRGPIFPSWTSARTLFIQEQTWKPLFSGVFDHNTVVCHKWDMHVAPILGRMFQIEGHPNWLLQGHFVDDVARADAFALCLDLYKRASYYLSPASMLWWVLARAQAATWEELGAIGDRPNRLHQVPQSSPVKMIESYARLAEGANGVDPFWDQVWSLAVELLAAQPSVVGPAAPRTRRGVTSLIAPCVWGPHERKGPGPPDPGLTVPHLYRWELAWEIFYPTSSVSFVSEGKITSRKWEQHAAPRLRAIFGIATSLSPHWAQSGHVDENARALSFRLCFRLYSKAAYFLSPALFLWWAIARVTARTGDELQDVGSHPRRLSAGPQQVPVAMVEGYRGMVAHSSARSNFWRDVWVIALNLLEHGSLPGGAPSSRGPRLINTSISDPTTWSTGAARATGSEFSSVTDGDGPACPSRKEVPGAGFPEVMPRWGQTGGGKQSPTVPVSWRTGPASLVGSAFSSDVEGDGPRSCILPVCERLGLWLFPPTLLATVPNVGDLACLCRADSNALVGPLFPVPPGPGSQVWPTESGDPRLLHKWRPEHDCAQLTVFFPDGLYNPISLSPKVSSPLLPFLTRMLGTLSLPGGWMVLHGTKPLRCQTTPSELGVRAGWRFEVSVVLSGLLGGHPQSWEPAWMSSRPSSPRRRLACSPDSFFRLSSGAYAQDYGRSSFPQAAMMDSIPFALPLPLPIPTAWVVPDSPHQPGWIVGSGYNASTWHLPPLLAQASQPLSPHVAAQWPPAMRAPKPPVMDFPIWDPVHGYWPLAACPRCMLEGPAPEVTSHGQRTPQGLGLMSVPSGNETPSAPAPHASETPIHLAPSPSESSSVMDISPSGSPETLDGKGAFLSTAPPAPAPVAEEITTAQPPVVVAEALALDLVEERELGETVSSSGSAAGCEAVSAVNPLDEGIDRPVLEVVKEVESALPDPPLSTGGASAPSQCESSEPPVLDGAHPLSLPQLAARAQHCLSAAVSWEEMPDAYESEGEVPHSRVVDPSSIFKNILNSQSALPRRLHSWEAFHQKLSTSNLWGMPKLPPDAGHVSCPRWWSRAAGPATLARFVVKRMEAGVCMGSTVLCFWAEVLEWSGFVLPDALLSVVCRANTVASRLERAAFRTRWRRSGHLCAERKQPLWASLDLIAVALASGSPRLPKARTTQSSPPPGAQDPWATPIAQVSVPHSLQYHSPRPRARSPPALSPICEVSEELSSASSSVLASALYNRLQAAHEEGEGIGSPSPTNSPSASEASLGEDSASDTSAISRSSSSGRRVDRGRVLEPVAITDLPVSPADSSSSCGVSSVVAADLPVSSPADGFTVVGREVSDESFAKFLAQDSPAVPSPIISSFGGRFGPLFHDRGTDVDEDQTGSPSSLVYTPVAVGRLAGRSLRELPSSRELSPTVPGPSGKGVTPGILPSPVFSTPSYVQVVSRGTLSAPPHRRGSPGPEALGEGVYTTDSGVLSMSHFPAGGNADSASTVGGSPPLVPSLSSIRLSAPTSPPCLAVGDRSSLNLLRNEYKNPILRKRLEVLEIDYPLRRTIRGDGNCFFRGLIFGHIEDCIRAGDVAAIGSTCNIVSSLYLASEEVWAAGAVVKSFLESIEGTLPSTQSGTDRLGLCTKVQAEMNAGGPLDHALVLVARALTGSYIKGRPLEYESLVQAMDFPSLEDYCSSEVEEMGVCAEGPALSAAAAALGTYVRVVMLGSGEGERCALAPVTFPSDSIFCRVHLLHMGCHYDLLSQRAPSFCPACKGRAPAGAPRCDCGAPVPLPPTAQRGPEDSVQLVGPKRSLAKIPLPSNTDSLFTGWHQIRKDGDALFRAVVLGILLLPTSEGKDEAIQVLMDAGQPFSPADSGGDANLPSLQSASSASLQISKWSRLSAAELPEAMSAVADPDLVNFLRALVAEEVGTLDFARSLDLHQACAEIRTPASGGGELSIRAICSLLQVRIWVYGTKDSVLHRFGNSCDHLMYGERSPTRPLIVLMHSPGHFDLLLPSAFLLSSCDTEGGAE